MKFRNIATFLSAFLLLAWYPYLPKKTLKEKQLVGPVKTVIENVDNVGENNIVVQQFNRSGQLTEIRYFASKRTKGWVDDTIPFFDYPDDNKEKWDSIARELSHRMSYLSVNGNYKGLDTNVYEFSRKISYHYSSTGKMINARWSDKNGRIDMDYFYRYNKQDSLLSAISYEYDSSGNVLDSSVTTCVYKYAANATEKREIYRNEETADTTYNKWTYDDKGRLEKEIWYANDDTYESVELEYHYNKDGSIHQEIYYSVDSLLNKTEQIGVIRYVYNDNRELVHKCTVRKEYFSTLHVCYYYVNDNGESRRSKIMSTEANHRDSTEKKEVAYFDKYDHLLRWDRLEGDSTINLLKVDYELDDYFNWTTLVSFNNGKVRDSLYRKIIYYDK